jgi:putative sporulation protein YtaF
MVIILTKVLLSIFEIFLLVLALSADAFVTSLAYGTNKIKIPFASVIVINLICTGVLALSILAGSFLSPYFPVNLAKMMSFIILFFLGAEKIFDSAIRTFIRKHSSLNKEFKFSMFNLNFILNVYADPQKADRDYSHLLSPLEAISLALALSFDGIAAGFGIGLAYVNIVEVIVMSFITGVATVLLGCYLGNKLSEKISVNLSWVSGLILLIISVMKLSK